MAQANVAPRIQGMTSQVAEQQSLDFDAIINFDMSGGTAKVRNGWEVLNAPSVYAEVADPMSPDGFSYVPSVTEYAFRSQHDPLGSFLWSGPSGDDYILSCHVWYQPTGLFYTKRPGFAVYDTQGRRLALAHPASWFSEPMDAVYSFARLYDDVFFCNGGKLWRWNPLRSMTPVAVSCFHNPQQIGVDTYALGEIVGASIVAVHQQSLVVAGFAADSRLDVDAPIDTNGDGIVTVLDFSKTGGFRLGPDSTSLVLTPYTMLVSDPLLPECFSIQGIYNLSTQQPVAGVASHFGRLVVMSGTECFVIDGPAAQASQATIKPLSTFVGCASHRSIAQSDDGLLLWLADDGIYSWDGGGLPAMVSNQIQDLFDRGWQAIWQRRPTGFGGSLLVNATLDTARTFRFDRSCANLASAVWVARGQYYAVAITASANAVEYNNVVLCWSPTRQTWWLYGGQPTSFGWALQTDGTNIWYEPDNTETIRSATTGMCALMVSQNQPGILFCQGFWCINDRNSSSLFSFPKLSYCLAAMVGDCDTTIDSGGTVARQLFNSYLQTSPFFLEQDAFKQNVWLNIKLRATRNVQQPGVRNTNPAKTDTVGALILSENAHFDILNGNQDSAELQVIATSSNGDVGIQPWPDAYIRDDVTYFWQSRAGADPLIGLWYDSFLPSTVLPAARRWLPDTYFNKRINLSRRASQWYRVVFWTRNTGCFDTETPEDSGNGGNSLDILGMSLEIETYTGTRK